MLHTGRLLSQTVGTTPVLVPDAHRPTPRDRPWLVRYSVRDAAGNAAPVRLREVHILCPQVSRGPGLPARECKWGGCVWPCWNGTGLHGFQVFGP